MTIFKGVFSGMSYLFKHTYTSIRKGDETQDLEDALPPSSPSIRTTSYVLVSIRVLIFVIILQLSIAVALIYYIFRLRQEISMFPLNSLFRDPFGNYCMHGHSLKRKATSSHYSSPRSRGSSVRDSNFSIQPVFYNYEWQYSN
jgi:hypothetical protein